MTEYSKQNIAERIHTYDILNESRTEQEKLLKKKILSGENTTDEEAVLDICRKFEEAALKDAVLAIHVGSRLEISKQYARILVTQRREKLMEIIA